MLGSPFFWGNPVNAFERSGKMELIIISHGRAYISYGKLGKHQKLRCLYHAVVYKKFLGGFPDSFLEYFAEIASV